MMNKGLSFVELLVSVAIFTVVLAGIHAMTYAGYFSSSRGSVLQDLQQQARNGLERIVKELRAATNQPTIAMVNANILFYG